MRMSSGSTREDTGAVGAGVTVIFRGPRLFSPRLRNALFTSSVARFAACA